MLFRRRPLKPYRTGLPRFALLLAALAMGLIGPANAASKTNRTATPTSSQRRALLNAICEGETLGTTCRTCPTYSNGDDPSGPITVGPYLLGSFVRPGASEAYVGLHDCDTNPFQFQGGVLLRKSGSKWRVVRYEPGLSPDKCERFPYETGTTLLACEANGGNQGYFITRVYAMYIGPTKTTTRTILSVQSNADACQKSVDIVDITSWKVGDVNGNALPDIFFDVSETHSRRLGDDPCSESIDQGDTRTYQVKFVFNGKTFAPLPSSKEIADCLNSDSLGEGILGRYCG